MQDGARRRSEKMIEHIRMAAVSNTRLVVDVGAADAFMLNELGLQLPGVHRIAVDISREYLRGNIVPSVQADGFKLPFRDSSVDILTCAAMLKHVHDAGALIVEFRRVLVPGGTLILVDPTPLGIRIGKLLGHFSAHGIAQTLSLNDTSRLVQQHGFMTDAYERFLLVPGGGRAGRIAESMLRHGPASRLFLNQILRARRR